MLERANDIAVSHFQCGEWCKLNVSASIWVSSPMTLADFPVPRDLTSLHLC